MLFALGAGFESVFQQFVGVGVSGTPYPVAREPRGIEGDPGQRDEQRNNGDCGANVDRGAGERDDGND